MENKTFSSVSSGHKREKITKVILSKNQDVTLDNIDKILNSIDFKKQYFVKVLSDSTKFRNIVMNEKIVTEDRKEESNIVRVYGDFEAGLYINEAGIKTVKPGSFNPLCPAAAIKYHVSMLPTEKKTYTLVVYQPKTS